MVDGSPHPDVSPLPEEDDDAWAHLQFRQLQTLAAVGLEIAVALSGQVAGASKDPEALRLLAITHDRVARSVRRTHALEARLRRELKAGVVARKAEVKAEADAQRVEAIGRRKAGLRRVGRQAISDHEPVFEQGGLYDALDDRLEDLCELDDQAFLERPFSTQLIGICEDLGLVPDFRLFRHEPWAIAEVRDRPPGSEYARFHDDMVAEGEWEDEEEEDGDIEPAIPPEADPPP